MIHLITGGSGSGKSEYAENWLIAQQKSKTENEQKERIYIATMQPFGEEAQKRIKRHRKMREEKGFMTIECYTDLHRVMIKKNTAVLLECMSNLVANELYTDDGELCEDRFVIEKIVRGIQNLKEQTDTLVIVTNEVTADGDSYSEETKAYQSVLGKINQEVAAMADLVTEVVYGMPAEVKH